MVIPTSIRIVRPDMVDRTIRYLLTMQAKVTAQDLAKVLRVQNFNVYPNAMSAALWSFFRANEDTVDHSSPPGLPEHEEFYYRAEGGNPAVKAIAAQTPVPRSEQSAVPATRNVKSNRVVFLRPEEVLLQNEGVMDSKELMETLPPRTWVLTKKSAPLRDAMAVSERVLKTQAITYYAEERGCDYHDVRIIMAKNLGLRLARAPKLADKW